MQVVTTEAARPQHNGKHICGVAPPKRPMHGRKWAPVARFGQAWAAWGAWPPVGNPRTLHTCPGWAAKPRLLILSTPEQDTPMWNGQRHVKAHVEEAPARKSKCSSGGI